MAAARGPVTSARLAIEQPMKFDFSVNLKTAKQIGLTIPRTYWGARIM